MPDTTVVEQLERSLNRLLTNGWRQGGVDKLTATDATAACLLLSIPSLVEQQVYDVIDEQYPGYGAAYPNERAGIIVNWNDAPHRKYVEVLGVVALALHRAREAGYEPTLSDGTSFYARRAADLQEGLHVLLTKGWIRGTSADPYVSAKCIINSIPLRDTVTDGRIFRLIRSVIVEQFPGYHWFNISEWNDAAERKYVEVLGVMVLAIHRAELKAKEVS